LSGLHDDDELLISPGGGGGGGPGGDILSVSTIAEDMLLLDSSAFDGGIEKWNCGCVMIVWLVGSNCFVLLRFVFRANETNDPHLLIDRASLASTISILLLLRILLTQRKPPTFTTVSLLGNERERDIPLLFLLCFMLLMLFVCSLNYTELN